MWLLLCGIASAILPIATDVVRVVRPSVCMSVCHNPALKAVRRNEMPFVGTLCYSLLSASVSQRCSPMSLYSGSIRFMRIFAVVLKIYVNFPFCVKFCFAPIRLELWSLAFEAWLCSECCRRTLNPKQLRHRTVSLRQHGFLLLIIIGSSRPSSDVRQELLLQVDKDGEAIGYSDSYTA